MTELRCLIDGQSAALVTEKSAAVFSRLYFVNGQFDWGEGAGRPIAGRMIERAVLDSLGLWVHCSGGYQALVPLASLKPSWKL